MFKSLLLCALFSLVQTLPLVPRDVWVPLISSPDATAVWVAGETYTVTWETSSKPSQVTNPMGKVFLRFNNVTQSTPLAQDFPLAAGHVDVTVPANTQPSDQWIVVLFGDSGNFSKLFTIISSS